MIGAISRAPSRPLVSTYSLTSRYAIVRPTRKTRAASAGKKVRNATINHLHPSTTRVGALSGSQNADPCTPPGGASTGAPAGAPPRHA